MSATESQPLLASDLDYDEIDLTLLESSIHEKSRKRGRTSVVSEQKKTTKSESKKLMDESISTGLAQPIPVTNKGYKLLKKFGYERENVGLGKVGGIIEPLSFSKREYDDKSGIGTNELRKRIENDNIEKLKVMERNRENILGNFRTNIQSKVELANSIKLLHTAAKVIYELDSRAGVDQHDLWPIQYQVLESNIELTENAPPDTKELKLQYLESTLRHQDRCEVSDSMKIDETNLSEVYRLVYKSLNYLRSNYFYCIHCGCAYEDSNELDSFCPGIEENDH